MSNSMYGDEATPVEKILTKEGWSVPLVKTHSNFVRSEIFAPMHFGESSKPAIPEYSITEPKTLEECKKRIDLLIDNIPEQVTGGIITMTSYYLESIESEIIYGQYRGWFVVSEKDCPKNLIWATK